MSYNYILGDTTDVTLGTYPLNESWSGDINRIFAVCNSNSET